MSELIEDITLNVFYSWQSDLSRETNQDFIRDALNSAGVELRTAERGAIRLYVDEATRDRPGSPNIPTTILEKIRSADVFVCDLTLINGDAAEPRHRVPNPNVLIELGFAIATLGWNRVIMLVNKAYGRVEDLPFDVRQHRATTYTLAQAPRSVKQIQGEVRNLGRTLAIALETVARTAPKRPHEESNLDPTIERRRRDVRALRQLMSLVYLPTLDRHIHDGPKQIHGEIFTFWAAFDELYRSSGFHLYDPTLASLVAALHKGWGTTLSFGDYYHAPRGSSTSYFSMPMDVLTSTEHERAWKRAIRAIKQLAAARLALLIYVQNQYLEIDLAETDTAALLMYKELTAKHDDVRTEGRVIRNAAHNTPRMGTDQNSRAHGVEPTLITDPRVLVVDGMGVPEIAMAVTREAKNIKKLLGVDSKVRHLPSATSGEVRNALTKERYDIVQMTSTVKERDGKVGVLTVDGHISAEPLLALLKFSKTRLLILASCNSVPLASEVSKQLNMIAAATNLAVDIFGEWQEIFYRLLSRGESLSVAFEVARATVEAPMELFLKEEITFPTKRK